MGEAVGKHGGSSGEAGPDVGKQPSGVLVFPSFFHISAGEAAVTSYPLYNIRGDTAWWNGLRRP